MKKNYLSLLKKFFFGARSSDLCITQFHRILCNYTEFYVTTCNTQNFKKK